MPSTLYHESIAKLQTNGVDNASKTNGHLDGEDENTFQHLSKPQQEILQLHGPRQRYRLDKAGDIPELRSEREILVQVEQSLELENKAHFQRS